MLLLSQETISATDNDVLSTGLRDTMGRDARLAIDCCEGAQALLALAIHRSYIAESRGRGPITAPADLIRSRQASSEEVATKQPSFTTITNADNPH